MGHPHLNMSFMQIGDPGATAIANVLKDTELTTLLLIESEIGDPGAIALANVLKGTQLTKLNIKLNRLTPDAKEKLRTAWQEAGKPAPTVTEIKTARRGLCVANRMRCTVCVG